MNNTHVSPYFEELNGKIQSLGGLFNAHLHLDRAGTYHATVELLKAQGIRDGSLLSLPRKHAIIPLIHNSNCFDQSAMAGRVQGYLDTMVQVGTSRADTVIDVTADRVRLTTLETFLKLKEIYRGKLDLRLGAYSPLGFRDDEPDRWSLLVEAAKRADFIGLLPERDDKADYPDHIGFEESCRRGIGLARELGKPIHIHVDQANHQYEAGAELVARLVRSAGFNSGAEKEPYIWLIHVISPSTYAKERFQRLASNLAELNIGVICCPSAAISMRQYQPFLSPTYNSIARVLEFLAAGIQVRMGSDNICDLTSPMGTPDLMAEVLVLANAVRFYDMDVLAKVAAGQKLSLSDREKVRIHLAENSEFVETVVRRHAPHQSKI